jgi:UDP-N-acetylglucosamine diphosphorylase/glucosamine-1-phosphate N-acetyltransferase
MPRAIIFDDRLQTLAPLTDLRASFDVRTGALTNAERLRAVLAQMFSVEVAAVVTSPDIAPLAEERTALPVNPPDVGELPRTVSLAHPSPTDSFVDDDPSSLLLINGRLVLPPIELAQLQTNQLLVQTAGDASRGESDRDEIIAVRLSIEDARAFLSDFQTLPDGATAIGYTDRCLMSFPWHAIAYRNEALGVDLAILMGRPSTELPDGVMHIEAEDGDEDEDDPARGRAHISPSATVYPTVVLDCSGGPIVIDDDATVRPGAIVCGPAYIGLGSTVLDRALVKANTAIGPVCKVAGEVGGTIFQGFANKAHDGHIGDSWIGEWANLGAGTTNSNLLNTYDGVNFVGPDGKRRRTGLTFLGSVIGDHVKTAIETRLMTGVCLGTGAMIACTAAPPNPTPAFGWVIDGEDGGPRVSTFRLAKFRAVAETVMARRGLEMSDAYAARLASLHAEVSG